jgi:uncharacterized protein (DUF885 family)
MQPMDANQRFEELVQETFQEMVERNPGVGTYIGIHTHDHLLPNGSATQVQEDFQWSSKRLKEFHALDSSGLSEENRFNLQLLNHFHRLEKFWFQDVPHWKASPDPLQSVGALLFIQMSRDYAPLEKRIDDICKRLAALPRYLKEFKTRIAQPIRLWTEIAIDSAKETPAFFDHIVTVAKGKVSAPLLSDLEKAAHSARKACEDYGQWLKGLLKKADNKWALGEERFAKLVELRELGMDVEEIYALGQKYLQDLKEERKKLAEEIGPGLGIEAVTQKIKGDHPKDFEEALKYYQKIMRESREFIARKKIATIPEGEELLVVETPAFMRQLIPFAAYFSPARFDAKQTGIYIVTPTVKHEQMMDKHNHSSISNTTVHEGYPGHHLQLTSANLKAPLARFLGFHCDIATEMVEGWAHYCEEMMKEYGFHNTPESRYIMVNDGIWRAVRILVDVRLSQGKMSVDEAVDMLMKETSMEREGALAEVHRYTQSPAYQLSYLLGKHQFSSLKADVKKWMGKHYSDRFFHDTILQAGSIPISYMRKIFLQKVKEAAQAKKKKRS